MTTANQAIRWTRHVIPALEELQYKLNGATKFTCLDMNHGYNQFELHPSSRHITTFYMPRGLRRFKRLNFGTNSATELFHEEIRRTLADISNAENIYDDILIHALTQEEHDATLIRVLQRFQDCGLTLGRKKCEFNKESIRFFGVIFSNKGLSPNPDKVEALTKLPAPMDTQEVRSFLGMLNFIAPFIPNYFIITAPLCALTKKHAPFNWTTDCQQAFERLKALMATSPVMTYFHPNRPTRHIVDGSEKDRVAATLTQQDPRTLHYKVIQYDSRALKATEKRYSQPEIESLPVLFGSTKNYMYLYGLPRYTVSTNHEPLLPLYSTHASTHSEPQAYNPRI